MKAAVLHAPNQPLTIEEVALRQAEAPRGAAAHRLCRAVPQRSAFHRGALPDPRRPACSATRAAGVVEAVGDGVTYVKPGDHVITCLSVFCGTCSQCVTGHPNLCENTEVKMLPGVARAPDLEGRADEPGVQPVVLRRADAGARKFDGEDRRRHPARPRRAGRLRRDDRGRRGVQRRQGRARRHGRGDRLRRGRAVGGQRRGARRGRAHHRDRHRASKLELAREMGATDTLNASNADPVEQVQRHDRRRRALFVRGARHQEHRRAVVRRCCARAAPRRSSAWCRSASRSSCTATISCATARSRAPRWAATASGSTCRGCCRCGGRAG